MSPPHETRARGRRLSDGRHQFRLPPDALAELHQDAEAAATAGDFAWITRFAAGDAELSGVSLLLMGNAAGAARRLEAAPGTLRRDLFRALARWVAAGDAASVAAVQAALARAPASPERAALAALLDRSGPLQALFVGGPMDRIAETAARFEGVWAAVGRPDPETGRIAVHPARRSPPPLGDDRRYDLILVDPSHWLPPDLDSFEGPAIAFIGDLEWHFAHDPARYARFDALLALGSQGALEARARFARPAFVGPIAAHIGLTPVDPAFLSGEAGAAWAARPRMADLIATGRQRHMTGFYFDKPVFNRTLLAADRRFAIRLENGMLPEDAYRAAMASARFVAASHRFSLGQSWRVFEALGCGAMALVDAAGGAAARFSEDFGVIHGVRSERLGADLARHLAEWPAYAERFAPRADAFFAELDSLIPPPERGAAPFVRTLRLGAALARIGMPDAALRRWRPDPGVDAAAAAGGGAGADREQPVIQSYIVARMTPGWRAAPQGAPTSDYAGALDRLALLHLRRALGEETDAALADAAAALAERFPEHGLPLLLRGVAGWARGRAGDPSFRALESLCARADALRFELFDGRPEWRIAPLMVGDLVDAAMRDGLRPAGGSGDPTPALRAAVTAMAWALRAGEALRRKAHAEAAAAAAEALSRRADLAYAAGTLLQARRRIWLDSQDAEAAAAFLEDFGNLAERDETLFNMFAWTAMRLLLHAGRRADARAVADDWLLQWARSGGGPAEEVVPRWSVPDPKAAWDDPGIRSALGAAGFDLTFDDGGAQG